MCLGLATVTFLGTALRLGLVQPEKVFLSGLINETVNGPVQRGWG